MLEPFQTNDTSFTLFHPVLNESYHSKKGALTESLHVFIQHGLLVVMEKFKNIRILEVGFGTGLNAYLTYTQTLENKEVQLEYHGLEPFPLPIEIVEKLGYGELVPAPDGGIDFYTFYKDVQAKNSIDNSLKFSVIETALQGFESEEGYDLIYYDAFAPHAQPELWSLEAMENLSSLAKPNAILVTYCAQSQFKRNLKTCGWLVEKLPGPPGKREMTRATYQNQT